jgi:lipopolysaccharide/colanic/teichoic acid biosynthesis glycosyltransferase
MANRRRQVSLAAKRGFDIFLSSCSLLVTSPILLLIAIAIKRDSKGPVFYRGLRVGRNGFRFRMLKFRTMVVAADTLGGSSTPDDDPRITRVGKFLRAHKLDELPQLWNVLRGEMSFVGPRPQVEWLVNLYTSEERSILDVPPGITDNASLRFPNEGEILRGSPDPDKDYLEKIHPEKMRLGLEYVRTRTFVGDLRIIAKTVNTLTKGKDLD